MSVIGIARIMKSAGMGKITELGKVLGKQPGQVVREATFANGRKGTYGVMKYGNVREQTVFDGVRKVKFETELGEQSSTLFFKGMDIQELYPRTHEWKISEVVGQTGGYTRHLASGHSKTTPINVKNSINNGKIKHKVQNIEEIHATRIHKSDKGFGTIFEHKDVLLSSQGKSMPIYQNPNTYYPDPNATFGHDLTKGILAFSKEGYLTRYTGQTPVAVLNRDLGANFQSKTEPLWTKLEEIRWKMK